MKRVVWYDDDTHYLDEIQYRSVITIESTWKIIDFQKHL